MEKNTSRITQLKLPQGFQSRTATLDDLEAVVALVNACCVERIGQPRLDADELRTEWSRPHMDLSRDTLVVLAPDGDLVGYAAIFDNPPHVRAPVWAEVHPGYQGQGVGAALIQWTEARGQSMVAKAPGGARVVLSQERLSTEKAAHALLKRCGYQLARHSLEMQIEMQAPPLAPLIPSGVTIRPMTQPDEEPATVQAIRDAFKGHWGYVQQPFEDDLKEWQNFFHNAPNCDPELLFVALEANQIVGTCFCVPMPAEGPQTAWVFALGVLRRWRRRGLGLALLQHGFVELYRKGKSTVKLNVDAQNLSGATRLYEKAGMYTRYRYDIFERELRPGEELDE